VPTSARPTSFADLTTLRVGGPIDHVTDAESPQELVAALTRPSEADQGTAGPPEPDRPLGTVLLGAGANTVPPDAGAIHVVRPAWSTIEVRRGSEGAWLVEVGAGARWSGLAERGVAEGWSGFEALVGIPGSVGAAPVQNIGAYGHDVAELIVAVTVWDRLAGAPRRLHPADLSFGYRTSAIKASHPADAGLAHPCVPRLVVLNVTFRARQSTLSAPVMYPELARVLDVPLGWRAVPRDVARAVLALRRAKGMLLDPADHDTWSTGSYFTNPILSADQAARLPADAPRFDAGTDGAGRPMVKTSAAWLMSHAGIARGWGLGTRATTSTKHVLALTNRGGATARDIRELAAVLVGTVHRATGIALTPEPVVLAPPG
jgi:UDP-N-acetylmuramate dehydrogenase